MLIGYARVSTDDQDPTLQIKALEEAGCERVYVDHKSGKNLKRPEWKRCRLDLQEGDTLVVWKLDRLARSVIDLHKIAEDFKDNDIELLVLTQNIDTRTASGRFLFTILAAVAEMERELISERTKAGIAQRKAEGRLLGRVPVLDPEAWQIAVDFIAESGSPSHQAVADHIFMRHKKNKRVSYNTISKYRDDLDTGKPYPEDWQARIDQSKKLKRLRAKQARQ